MAKFREHFSKEDETLVKPLEGLKRAYGVPKLHKQGAPVRPIVSSLNSITCGAEEYFKSLVKHILDKCEFSLNSIKQFKEKFLADKMQFDRNLLDVVSYDAVSLYTSVNVERTIDYI